MAIPVLVPGEGLTGKIEVIVSGGGQVTSTNPNVVIVERKT